MAGLETIESGLVVVTDPIGDFILHERATGTIDEHMYQFLGGHTEPEDEDSLATAMREFREETNISDLVDTSELNVKPLNYRVRWLCESRSEEYLVGIHALRLPVNGLELAEGQGGRLVTIRNDLTVIRNPDVPITRFARRVLGLVVQSKELPNDISPEKYELAA